MHQEITLVGKLRKDAELRYTPNGTAVCDFIVVVSDRWEDDEGTVQERETRFRVTAWGGLAEDSSAFLTEGRLIMLVGRADDAYAWMDEDGDAHARIDLTAWRIVPVAEEAENMQFQQVVLAGNLGRDPELRHTPSGVPVTDFSIAVNEYWSDRETGERQEKTIWFRVTVWRRQAETVSQYLSKGRKALVIGRMDPASAWIGRGGEARGTLEVTATRIQFMDSRADAASSISPTVYNGPSQIEEDDEIPF